MMITDEVLVFVFIAELCPQYLNVLSLVLPPMVVVPVVLILEASASAIMFGKVRQSVDWAGLTWIWIGAAMILPLGIWLLA